MRTQIMLGYLHSGSVTHEFHESVLRVSKDPNILITGVEGHVNVSTPRNELVKIFLHKTKADYLLSVDSDMAFTMEDIERLVAHRLPVVSGLCLGKKEGKGVFAAAGKTTDISLAIEECDGSTFEVAWVGMAFCLIYRTVLQNLGVGPLWPYADTLVDGKALGEDVVFCLRAKEKGFKIFIDTAVHIGHVKQMVISFDGFR